MIDEKTNSTCGIMVPSDISNVNDFNPQFNGFLHLQGLPPFVRSLKLLNHQTRDGPIVGVR